MDGLPTEVALALCFGPGNHRVRLLRTSWREAEPLPQAVGTFAKPLKHYRCQRQRDPNHPLTSGRASAGVELEACVSWSAPHSRQLMRASGLSRQDVGQLPRPHVWCTCMASETWLSMFPNLVGAASGRSAGGERN